MLYYQVNGSKEAEEEVEEKPRSARRENMEARMLGHNTKVFHHENLEDSFYIFVSEKEDTEICMGILMKEGAEISPEKVVSDYLSFMKLEYEEIRIVETTYIGFWELMHSADRMGYIEDTDEIADEFQLLDMSRHLMADLDYRESLYRNKPAEKIEKFIQDSPCKENLEKEYELIRQGCAGEKVFGQPVHYLIQSSDADTLEETSKVLLEALYQNGRLSSKRYAEITIGKHSEAYEGYFHAYLKSYEGGALIVNVQCQVQDTDQRSGGVEILENLCQAVNRYHNHVLTIFCLPRNAESEKEFLLRHLGGLTIQEIKEEYFSAERARAYLSAMAEENHVKADEVLLGKIKDEETYLVKDMKEIYEDWYSFHLKNVIYPQYKDAKPVVVEKAAEETKGTAIMELEKMVGLRTVKDTLHQILNYHKAMELFHEKGMTMDQPSMHMVFTGNPGTAKTTVARLFAKVLKDNDILSSGRMVEVGRSDLVGKYVGWTAPTIKKKFKSAEGGVLFIDEAYSLVDDREGSYGDEAINTIVQEMENHRDNTMVIFAGYPDKMEQFLKRNPGLRSRISYHVDFPDYTEEELLEIADLISGKKGLKLADETREKLLEVFQGARESSDFGNGRYVRNVIEKAKVRQASRLLASNIALLDKKDFELILPEDIEVEIAKKKEIRKMGFLY